MAQSVICVRCMACVKLVFFRAPVGVFGEVMTPKGSISRSGQLLEPTAPANGHRTCCMQGSSGENNVYEAA